MTTLNLTIMQTKTFKKPSKWLENLMLIVLPVVCAIILALSIYFKVFMYHPSTYNNYEIQAKR